MSDVTTLSGPNGMSDHDRDSKDGRISTKDEQTNGRFEILKMLGEGGMNRVYLAKDAKTGQEVALRAFEHGRKESDEIRQRRMQRMRREARIMQDLEHPNFPKFIACLEAPDGDGYIVMERVRGRELTHVIESAMQSNLGEKPHGSVVPRRVLASVGRQLFAALGKMHGMKHIHRDIKPANIMYEESEKGFCIKLIDFGLGKSLGQGAPEDSLTQEGDVMGSLEYMAPEQLLNTKGADERADLYAVGAVLYEMVTGRRSVDMTGVSTNREGIGRVLAAHAKPLEPASYPREFVEDMNPLLEQLIIDLLERDPEKRPQTAAVALKRFEAAMASHEPSKPSLPRISDSVSTSKPLNNPSEPPQIPMTGGGGTRWIIGGLVVVAIACIGAFVTFKWLSQEPVKNVSPASTTTERSPFASSSARVQASAPPVQSQPPIATVTTTATAPPLSIRSYASLTAAQRAVIDRAKADLARGGKCEGMTRDLVSLSQEVSDFPDTYYYLAECAKRMGKDDSSFRAKYLERSGGRTSP